MMKTVLVTGATGAQGGAVVDALLGGEFAVRALVRDPESPGAIELARRGVEVMRGDFEDSASLAAALNGGFGVFSVQLPPAPQDPQRETRHGRTLVQAARDAGVEVFVHTSVARAGDHENFEGWQSARWWPDYWLGKDSVNRFVASAGFAHWVILKPAYMMDNFLPPKSGAMYPGLKLRSAIEHAMGPDTRLDLIAAADVGRFAAAAFTNPARFDHMEIDLAAEALTMDEVAQVLSRITGKPVTARSMTAREAVDLGNNPGLTESQRWSCVEGYKVDAARANARGIALERFDDWAEARRQRFEIGTC